MLHFITFLLSIFGVLYSGQIITKNTRILSTTYDFPPLVELHPDAIRILTFGHPSIYKDFIYIWLLQSLTDTPHQPDTQKMMRLIKSIMAHKPDVESIYMLSCFVMTQVYKAPENCQEIIDIGLKVFPNSFRLAVTQAYIFAFILDNPLKASGYYLLASRKPNAPPHFKRLAIRLANSLEVSIDDFNETLEIMLGNGQSSLFRAFIKNHAAHLLKPKDIKPAPGK